MTPNYERRGAFGPFLQGLVYAVVAGGGLLLIAWAADETVNQNYFALAAMAFVMCWAVYRQSDLLKRWELGRMGSIGTHVYTSWIFIATFLILVSFATRQIESYSRWVLLSWLLLTPLGFSLVHVIIRYGLLRLFPRLSRSRTAVIVFVSPSAKLLADSLNNLDTPSFKLLGFFEDREPERIDSEEDDLVILGGTDELSSFVNENSVEVVFVVLPAHGADRAFGVVEQLGDTTASVYYVPDFRMFDLSAMSFSDVGGLPVLGITENPFFGADGLLKRVMDIVFSTLVLIILAPLFLFISLCILVTMGRPIFFNQTRYGLDGKEIKVHKFRSMRVQEDGAVVNQATRDDPRITAVGRFLRRTSIDEWPQFWNVLKGEMSVVGPRPHAVAHNELYRKLIKRYMVRHKVKPGMTGWAQVNGLRGETRDVEDMQQRVKFDIDYIQRWSPEFDIRIVLQTLWIIFQDHEAY